MLTLLLQHKLHELVVAPSKATRTRQQPALHSSASPPSKDGLWTLIGFFFTKAFIHKSNLSSFIKLSTVLWFIVFCLLSSVLSHRTFDTCVRNSGATSARITAADSSIHILFDTIRWPLILVHNRSRVFCSFARFTFSLTHKPFRNVSFPSLSTFTHSQCFLAQNQSCLDAHTLAHSRLRTKKHPKYLHTSTWHTHTIQHARAQRLCTHTFPLQTLSCELYFQGGSKKLYIAQAALEQITLFNLFGL